MLDREPLAAFSEGPPPDMAGRPRQDLGIRQGLLEWFEHLEALVHESLDMLAVLDKDGFILYESPSTIDMLGGPRVERAASPWWHWVHPEDQVPLGACVRSILKAPKDHVVSEYRIHHRDGAWHWVRSTFSNQLQHPSIQGILVNTQDITQRKELELDLKARESQLRSVAQALPDLYLVVRHDGFIVEFQDQGFDHALKQVPRIAGMNGQALPLPEEVRGWILGQVKRACETSQSQSGTYEIEIDGKRHLREARIQPSGADRALVLIRDVTAFRRNLNRRLQAGKYETLGTMARGISHHFNNLLMIMQGNLELAALALPKELQVKRNLDSIQKAITQAAGITNQLRDLAGIASLLPEMEDLNKVIRHELALGLEGSPFQHAMEFHLGQNLPKVSLERKQIRCVLLNLIANAREAMGTRPGSIRISTRKVQLDEETITSGLAQHNIDNPGHFLAVEVQDTGCGMDRATLARIFDPFFTTKPAGRGLGLCAAAGIIRAHHGGIKVESQLAYGSKVTIYLPLPQAGEGLARHHVLTCPTSSNAD